MIRTVALTVTVFAALLLAGCSDESPTTTTTTAAPADPNVTFATVDLDITGMTCEGCVGSVERALVAMPGVKNVTVTLDDQTKAGHATIIAADTLDADTFAQAVNKLNFSATVSE